MKHEVWGNISDKIPLTRVEKILNAQVIPLQNGAIYSLDEACSYFASFMEDDLIAERLASLENYDIWTVIEVNPSQVWGHYSDAVSESNVVTGIDEIEDGMALRYAIDLHLAPPVVLTPIYGNPNFEWQTVDGQTRCRAGYLSGQKVRALVPVSDRRRVERADALYFSGFIVL